MIAKKLKFTVEPTDLTRIERALAMVAQQGPSRSTLVSTYFDTADGALKKRGMALRVRKRGRRFLQTVKSEDPSADLAAREQWEDSIRQETSDLTAAESGARLQQAVGAGDLKPLFLRR